MPLPCLCATPHTPWWKVATGLGTTAAPKQGSKSTKPAHAFSAETHTHLVEDGDGVEHKGDGEAGDREGAGGEQHGLDPGLALVARIVAAAHVAAQGDHRWREEQPVSSGVWF